MVTFFKNFHLKIDISLDGDEEGNADRVFINGKPSFDTVYKNIQLLKANNVNFSCKSVIKPDNHNLLSVFEFDGCIYNHRTTKTNQKYPSVNL